MQRHLSGRAAGDSIALFTAASGTSGTAIAKQSLEIGWDLFGFVGSVGTRFGAVLTMTMMMMMVVVVAMVMVIIHGDTHADSGHDHNVDHSTCLVKSRGCTWSYI